MEKQHSKTFACTSTLHKSQRIMSKSCALLFRTNITNAKYCLCLKFFNWLEWKGECPKVDHLMMSRFNFILFKIYWVIFFVRLFKKKNVSRWYIISSLILGHSSAMHSVNQQFTSHDFWVIFCNILDRTEPCRKFQSRIMQYNTKRN